MIVVDTNIIIYLHFTSEHTPLALRLLEKDPYWLSPPLWRSEFCNVLTGYIRKGRVTLNQAQQIMLEAQRTMFGREIQVTSDHVLELAAISTCSAYDCEFVALARNLDVKLVTSNKQILEQFPAIAVALYGFV
jgi:predicted nucleic acid-binding protein